MCACVCVLGGGWEEKGGAKGCGVCVYVCVYRTYLGKVVSRLRASLTEKGMRSPLKPSATSISRKSVRVLCKPLQRPWTQLSVVSKPNLKVSGCVCMCVCVCM